jgi:enediyne biosynthesis protein E4
VTSVPIRPPHLKRSRHAGIVSALLSLLSAPVLGATIRFAEVSRQAGLDFVLRNGAASDFSQVELMPAGIAAFDYDGDGCTDLFFVNGADVRSLRKERPEFRNRLFRNNCDLTFSDVTDKAGLAGEGYSMAAATADYDNDGHPDLFVAGVHRNFLYRNRGDGTFEDVTSRAGLAADGSKDGPVWSISAGWFDFDNDGWLDLFVSNYVQWKPSTEPHCGLPEYRMYCHPNLYSGLPNQLFRNNRNGTFSDVSAISGVRDHVGKGMGVAFGDFDGDGFTDVFVANDSVRHFLFANRGGRRLDEVAFEAGVALPENGTPIAGMGADFRDLDNDGRPDIVVAGMAADSFQLFRNRGDERLYFEDSSVKSRLAVATLRLTGWSLGAFDFDNDGWKDLFFATSHFPRSERHLGRSELPNHVFRNLGDARFEDVSSGAGDDFQVSGHHHGAAFADFDNDGRVDVVVNALNEPARLFRNVTADSGHWIAFNLTGVSSNRDGIGAVVRLELPGGRTLYNHATTSVGYACSSEPLIRFGLGTAQVVESAEIRWPSGIVQRFGALEADRIVRVKEPARGRGEEKR